MEKEEREKRNESVLEGNKRNRDKKKGKFKRGLLDYCNTLHSSLVSFLIDFYSKIRCSNKNTTSYCSFHYCTITCFFLALEEKVRLLLLFLFLRKSSTKTADCIRMCPCTENM